MSVFHDEVEIEDFEYDPETETYYYPCPCGDQFEITKVRDGWGYKGTSLSPFAHSFWHSMQEALENGEEIAECPSCSLIVKVIYDPVSDSFCTYTLCFHDLIDVL